MAYRRNAIQAAALIYLFTAGAAPSSSETVFELPAVNAAAAGAMSAGVAAVPPPNDSGDSLGPSSRRGVNFAAKFAASVEAMLPLKMDGFLAVSDKVLIANPAKLQQWGILNTNTAASYNSLTRTIVVPKDSTTKENGHIRLQTVPELAGGENGAVYAITVSQIFHEMAHAEYDFTTKAGATADDKEFLLFLDFSVKPWLARAYPNLSSRIRKCAVSEIYGYYRAETIDNLFREHGDVYLENGYNMYTKKCFAGKRLKEDALKMPLEDFKKYYSNDPRRLTPYRDILNPGTVFSFGKAIDLMKPGDPFPQELLGKFWDRFEKNFHPARDRQELIDFMNSSPEELANISACRERLWHEVRNSRP